MTDHYRNIRDTTGKKPLTISDLKTDSVYGTTVDEEVF